MSHQSSQQASNSVRMPIGIAIGTAIIVALLVLTMMTTQSSSTANIHLCALPSVHLTDVAGMSKVDQDDAFDILLDEPATKMLPFAQRCFLIERFLQYNSLLVDADGNITIKHGQMLVFVEKGELTIQLLTTLSKMPLEEPSEDIVLSTANQATEASAPEETEPEKSGNGLPPTTWTGSVLNKGDGVCQGPSGRETFYNLKMSGVIRLMRALGYSEEEYPYWVRSDGAKMFGSYIMVAANLSIRPKGTILETSLGWAMVVDTGDFVKKYPYGIDVAVDWKV